MKCSTQQTPKSLACQICFDKINLETAIDTGSNLLTCTKCGITIHNRCYGSSDPHSKTFTCDKCGNSSLKPKTCLICDHSEGYLKQLTPEIWLHPICGLLTDDVEITDFATMRMELPHGLLPQGTVPQCEFCGVATGQRLQCEHLGCLKATHAYCAYHAKAINQANCWQIDLGVENEVKETPYPELKKYMDSQGDTQSQGNIQLVPKQAEEIRMTRSSRRLAGSEANELKQRNPILLNRKGHIAVYCQSHRLPAVYCICGGNKTRVKKDENWMIACDYCDNWYHGECIGISKTQSELITVYICDQCQAWENAKKSHLLNELEGKYNYSEESVLKNVDWNDSLIPAKSNKLIDILLISHIYLLRSEIILKFRCNMEMLYNHLMHGVKIPINFSNLIEKLKKKMEISIQLDTEVLSIINKTLVLTIIDKAYNLITQNFNKNEETKKLIDTYMQKYCDEVKVYTKQFDKLRNTQLLLESLHEIGTKFFSCIEIDEASMHLRRLEESGLGFNTETQFLKDMISEFKGWEERLTSLKRLQITDDMIFPEGGIGQLDSKIQVMTENLKVKIHSSRIEQLLQECALHFIRKKAISDLLITEKQLFEERERIYKEFISSGCTLEQLKKLIKEMCEGLIFSESNLSILKDYDSYLRLYFISTEILKNGVLIDEYNGDITKAKCTFEDIETIIHRCEQNTIRPLDILEALRYRITEVNKWRESYKEMVNRGESTETLHAFIIKGEDYKLSLPEFENIQSQVEVLKFIEAFTNSQDSITLPYLTQLINKAIDSNVPSNIITPLQVLLESSQSLLTESERLIAAATESYKEIDKVCGCIESIKKGRVLLSTLETLEKIVEEYKWQAEVASLVNISSTNNIEFGALESLSKEVLEEEYKRSETISHNPIGPVGDLRKKIPEIIWLKNAKIKLDPTNKLSEKELSELVEGMNQIVLTPSHPFCGTFVKLVLNLNEKYAKIMADYDYLTKLNIDNVQETEIDQLIQKTRNLKQDAFICQVNLSDLIGKIHKIEQYIASYQVLMDFIKNKESVVDYSGYAKALDNFAALQEGHGESKVLEKVKEQMGRYKLWIIKVNTYKTTKEALIKGSSKQKLSLDSLRQILHDAEEIEFPLGTDLEMIKRDIDLGEKNEYLAKDYLVKLKNKDMVRTEELENLLNGMKALPLYSSEIFTTLANYLLLYQFKDFIKEDSSVPKRRLDNWTILLKERDKIIAEKSNKEILEELADETLLNTVMTRYREGMMLMKQVNDLKKYKIRERFSNIDLELLLEFLQNSNINFQQEIKYVEELMKKSKTLHESFKELIEIKGNITEFKTLRKQILKLPLNLNGSEDKLNVIIKKGANIVEDVKELLEENRKNNSKLTEAEFLPILKEYNKLACKIDEIENLKIKYEESKINIVKLKETLEGEFSVEKMLQITNGIFELPIEMNISINTLSLQLCRKKYMFINKKNDISEYKPTLMSLRILLEDFKNLKDDLDPLDLEKIKHLEQLLQGADCIVKRVKEITTLNELSKYGKEISKEFIDYTDIILEQKARIKSHSGLRIRIAGKRAREENVEASLIAKGYNIVRSKHDLDKLVEKTQQEKEFREKTQSSFEVVINENSKLRKGKKKPRILAQEIEDELMKQANGITGFYRERANQIKNNLAEFSNYPLLSEYISNGKLNLWKLLKQRDNYTFLRKLKKIEGLLLSKGKKVKKVEEDNSSKKDLRLKLLQDDKTLSERYDPLQLFPQRMSTRINKEEDNESLEDVEIIGNTRGAFIMEQIGQLGTLPIPYQPTMPLFATENKSYNPLDSEDQSAILNRLQFNRSNALIPYSYDANEQAEMAFVEVAAPGSLYKIWAGRINTGGLSFQASMLTCDDVRDYHQVPALNIDLEVDGRAKLPSVFDYINTNASHLLILKGWVIVEENSEILNRYLYDMENTDNCGVIDLKEIASHLYLIPWNGRTQQFIQQWRINPVLEHPMQNTMIKFAYFFTYKRRDLFEMYRPMRPTLIQALEVPSTFPGVDQADIISDDEGQPSIINPPEDEKLVKEALKEKLSALSMDEINNLKQHLTDKNREDLEKFIEEAFPSMNPNYPSETIYPSTMQPTYPLEVIPNCPVTQLNYPSDVSASLPATIQPSYPIDTPVNYPSSMQTYPPEISSNYPPEAQVVETEEQADYMSKVWNVQGFIDRNRSFFIQYASEPLMQPEQIMYVVI